MIASDARTHRPECEMAVTNGMSQVGSMQWDGTTFWLTDAGQVAAIPQKPCVCERIERAEERVLSLNSVALGVLIAQRARERALDAAREAIKSVCHQHPLIWPTDEGAMQALDAAIDALKEKP